MKYITVALAKGRLSELSVDILGEIGLNVGEIKEESRKLIFTDEENKFKFILVKASDVPIYVEYGAADIGIVGRDTILEEGRSLYEVLDLNFGQCKIAVAGPEKLRGKLDKINNLRVATKYANIARQHFEQNKRQGIEVIKLNGSVELAPLVGLSEVIVDIVESGKTLKENGLEILEEICEISAKLVVNRVSMKINRERILSLVENIKQKVMGT